MLVAIIALWFARGVPERVELGFSGVGHRHFHRANVIAKLDRDGLGAFRSPKK
jgi:hypothetical protein